LNWLKLLIKLLLFLPVGCLYYCINDARSHKHQIPFTFRKLCSGASPIFFLCEMTSCLSLWQDIYIYSHITNQMHEDDLENLRRKYYTRPKEVYQGLTGDGWWWWWWYIHSQSLQTNVPMTSTFLVYEDDHGSVVTENALSNLNAARISTPYCIWTKQLRIYSFSYNVSVVL